MQYTARVVEHDIEICIAINVSNDGRRSDRLVSNCRYLFGPARERHSIVSEDMKPPAISLANDDDLLRSVQIEIGDRWRSGDLRGRPGVPGEYRPSRDVRPIPINRVDPTRVIGGAIHTEDD